MAVNSDPAAPIVRSLIPARLDQLPWTRFHTRLIMTLGAAWMVDGLEITLAGAVAGVLTNSDTLHRTPARRSSPAETPRGRRPAPVRGRPAAQGRLLPSMQPSGTGASAAA